MNILVNGPSVSRGPNTWPYFIQQHLGSDLVNLSQAGAGNYYISDSTIEELSKRRYDLVVVMWADLRRFDIKVKCIEYFKDTIYTSQFAKTMNDWPEKIIKPVNDQDYVDDNWVFGCGYINERNNKLDELFESYYNHTDTASQYFMGYMKIIALQSFLKSINQPYAFCSVRKLTKLERFESLYNLLDFDHIINDLTPHELANQLDSWEPDRLHPGSTAHRVFAEHMINFLQQKNLVK